MDGPDRIPVALRVARPAVRLGTPLIIDPCQAGPESQAVPKRTRPSSPLQRLQEIVTLGLPQDEMVAMLKEFLSGQNEEDLKLIMSILETSKVDANTIGGLDAQAIWRGIGAVISENK